MPTTKASILAGILNDAEGAKQIPGMKNVYEPGEYEKVMAAKRVQGELESSDGFLRHNPGPGAIEFDERTGGLRKINRNAPTMMDLHIYAANRYMVEKEEHEEPVKDKEGKETGKTKTVVDSLELILVLGLATVRGIDQKAELPKSVKAYRFKKVDKHFEYVKTELIADKVAYEMVNTLNPYDCLKLMQQINPSDVKGTVGGDKLNDLLK